MPVITLPYRYLERLVGLPRETIVERLPMFGSDIERREEDHVDVEFFANRPDLFSTEGAARALRGFLGLEEGPVRYETAPSGIAFSVDPGPCRDPSVPRVGRRARPLLSTRRRSSR